MLFNRKKDKSVGCTSVCAEAREEKVDIYNITTLEALKIVQQLQGELKKHYQDHKTKRDEYLLSKANLDASNEEKANATRNIKKGERWNQCYNNFKFHQGTGVSAQEINWIQILMSWNTTEEYEEDDEFQWIDPKKCDKDDESL